MIEAGARQVSAAPLAGIGVVVTRPKQQARKLADLIRNAGGEPILFPALEIFDAHDVSPVLAMIERLDEFDLTIFVSPNAVNKAMSLIMARRALPEKLKVAAIGGGTAAELKRFGIEKIISPAARFDSEALLELPELREVKGRRIVIFRGNSGREVLRENLTTRGAAVEYVECYGRGRPDDDAAILLNAWARGKLHAITVTSSEGLQNLHDMVGEAGRQWLNETPLFVPHERIAKAAGALGLARVVVTGAGDQGLLKGLIEWFAKTR